MTREASKPTTNRGSEQDFVVWNRIPIIGLPELACVVPVTADGRAIDEDGEPLPLEDRPNPCGEDGTWIIGSAPVCKRHFPEVAAMYGDSAEAIEAAYRDRLNGL